MKVYFNKDFERILVTLDAGVKALEAEQGALREAFYNLPWYKKIVSDIENRIEANYHRWCNVSTLYRKVHAAQILGATQIVFSEDDMQDLVPHLQSLLEPK